MKDDESRGGLAYLGPMGTHLTGLKAACANQGVHIELRR